MPHFVYILLSLKDHKYYIGQTADVQKRLQYHYRGIKEKIAYTKSPLAIEVKTRNEKFKKKLANFHH